MYVSMLNTMLGPPCLQLPKLFHLTKSLVMNTNYLRGNVPIVKVYMLYFTFMLPPSIGIRSLRRAESDAWTLASGTKDGHYQVILRAV